MDWIIEELATLCLGDKRLNKRAQRILAKLSKNPTDSIPAACSGADETKATYRFFDNEQVTPEKIQATHLDATLSRMAQQKVVLIPQDTTVLNFSTQYNRDDAGPTTKVTTRGIYLHTAIAITPDKVTLGYLSSKQWYRTELQKLTRRERTKKDYKPVEVTAILCFEINPPADVEKIEWLLITDLSVVTFEEAYEKIHWYTCRWQIEIFFKVLKSGCTIEKLQLTEKNFSACLSFYMIIAWRIMYVVVMGRHCPEMSCECVFSKEEWQTTYVVVHRKKPPEIPPTLNEMTRMVASLGGYINRKSNPEPGVKTMWIGLRNMQEHLKAKEAFEAVYGPTCG